MNDKEKIATLVEALSESQSLLAAMMHEKRPNSEINKQLADNRTALEKVGSDDPLLVACYE